MSGASLAVLAAGAPPAVYSFADVKLLMGFEGTNGSTGAPGMTDESSAAHGNATVNGASISTAQHKFGSSSLTLNGTTNDIAFADNADWNFGSGKFTVEMFVFPNSVTGNQFLCGQWQTTGDLGWILWMSGTSLSWNTSTNGSDNNADIAAGTMTTGAWQHVCIDYDGLKYRLYRNGTMIGSFSTPRSLNDSTDNLAIGSTSTNSSFHYNGFIDELRITKGWAQYASDGGFTVPIAAFPRS